MSKRGPTLDSYLQSPPAKKVFTETPATHTKDDKAEDAAHTSKHVTYPFAISHLPVDISELMEFAPADEGRAINNQPHLDLVYYQPYIPKDIHRRLFEFLRGNLFWYRVKYMIRRGPVETMINTPRWTTVFGVDETSRFERDEVVDAKSGQPVPQGIYKCRPRPLPECLDRLRKLTEGATGCKFNFALVNYYASGDDSISYHSDDERFLGTDPAIASFSLGAKRDFLMKHKPTAEKHVSETQPMKLPLSSGDMVLMRGKTQSNWLHSIPKRKGGEADKGRINITLRRAMVKGGTENYYHYNVGDGAVFKWDAQRRAMVEWKAP